MEITVSQCGWRQLAVLPGTNVPRLTNWVEIYQTFTGPAPVVNRVWLSWRGCRLYCCCCSLAIHGNWIICSLSHQSLEPECKYYYERTPRCELLAGWMFIHTALFRTAFLQQLKSFDTQVVAGNSVTFDLASLDAHQSKLLGQLRQNKIFGEMRANWVLAFPQIFCDQRRIGCNIRM